MDPFGPYQPLNELARGGMGAVYRARDTRSGGLVALKVILDLAGDLELLERFQREVTFLRDVEHPHLVRVLDADLRPPRPWAAFELVEGGTLEQRVLRDGPLPWRDAVRIVSEIAAGVSAAHEQGLLHRDIKPANVLLGPAGAKLADFGLVKDLDRKTLTQSGATLGTPAYLAPEQIGSEKARWGPPTDVYGLAATLFFALTGHPPFAGASVVNTLRSVLEDPPPSLRALAPDVPAELESTCLRGLAKLGTDRHPSAIAFRAALLHGQADRRRRRWAWGLIPVAALAAAAPLFTRWGNPAPPNRPPTTEGGEDVPEAGGGEAARQEAHLAVLTVTARALLSTGNAEGALKYTALALDLDPEHVPALVARGEALRQLEQLGEALEALEQAQELAVDRRPEIHEDLCHSLSLVFRDQGDFTAERRALEDGLDAAPDSIQLRRNLALNLARAHEWEPALGVAQELVTRDSATLESHLLYATLLDEAGRADDALLELEALLELDDHARDWRVFATKARVETHLARFRDAKRDLRVAQELAQGTPRYERELAKIRARALPNLSDPEAYASLEQRFDHAIELDPERPEPWVRRGALRLQAARVAEAIADSNRALELDPDCALAYHLRGRIHLARREPEPARENLQRAAELDPELAVARFHLAAALLILGEKPAALDALDEAIRLGFDDPLAFLKRGTLRLELKVFGALSDFDRALELDDRLAEAHLGRGRAHEARGDVASAAGDFERATTVRPTYEEAYLAWAKLLLRSADLEGAHRVLTRGLEATPGSGLLCKNRGALRFQGLGDPTGGLADLTRAVELSPQDDEALLIRGQILESQGRFADAVVDYTRAVELAPRSSRAWTYRGTGLMNLGDFQGALESFDRALGIETNPEQRAEQLELRARAEAAARGR